MATARENDELTAEQKKAILDERAAILAQAPAAALRLNQLDVLEFLIASERFAVEARFVREATKLFALTPLPCTPEFVLGLINFRGQIMPLLDLREILELPGRTANMDSRVVVVQTRTVCAAISVDEISGIRSLPELELQSARQLVRPSLWGLFKGVTGDRLAVLDIEALFADPRLIVDGRSEEKRCERD
jgi:purine-binding chemotaxis protein CheW